MATISNKYKHGDIIVAEDGLDFGKVLHLHKIVSPRKLKEARMASLSGSIRSDIEYFVVAEWLNPYDITYESEAKVRLATKAEKVLFYGNR